MQPMTPEERQKLLSKPGVTEDDIDEYEQLLAQRQLVDPTASPTDADVSRDKRISELYHKLYDQDS